MRERLFTEMQEEDLATVLGIYNHYVSTTTVTFDPAPISVDAFRARVPLNHERYGAYVIRPRSAIVGFCFICPFKKHEAYSRTAELGIYLRPECTRKGFGTKAVKHLVQVATTRGLRMLIASISGENTHSVAFFGKIGWQQCARFRAVGEKWGRSIDVVFFQKELGTATGGEV